MISRATLRVADSHNPWSSFWGAFHNTNHLLSTNMIVGTYTERIGITNTAVSYLDQTNSGGFVLVRDLPRQAAITNGVALPPLP